MLDKNLRDTDLYEERFGFKERNSFFRYCLVLFALFLLIFGTRLYFTTAFGGITVLGPSMNNTLYSGQRLLMRPTDDRHKADYGDIIVVYVGDYAEFQYQNAPDYLIKRLIAKEGDRVYCRDEQVYIQYGGEGAFVALDEPYAYYAYPHEEYEFEVYEVGEGEIFFLGDNREISEDSRYKTGESKLSNRLYKETDIYGVVPDWAVKYDKILEVLFFPSQSVSG